MNQHVKDVLMFGAAMFTAAVGWVSGMMITVAVADAIEKKTKKQKNKKKNETIKPLHAVR